MSELTQIRCRFAPSPTGALHVGGARTGLFNYLFARKMGGTHVLRVEDTDRERSTEVAVQAILDGMNWLGIEYDEGPFFQSQRMELYQLYAKMLLERGMAYHCSCSVERLDQVREELREKGEKPRYDRLHRPKEPVPQSVDLPTGNEAEPFVVRLRVPLEGHLAYHDLIVGDVTTPYQELDDFIIVRSDGTPTYNFTVVVDDVEMKISHVIRGMDHISNTPKQVVIYNGLGCPHPAFAHVPMILGKDKKKLSKRHGATSVFEYKKDGYLADAFVNYLARLSWSHGDQEIFTRKELEQYFSLENVGKSAAVFDPEKLMWVNGEHIKGLTPEQLLQQLHEKYAEAQLSSSNLENDQGFLKLLSTLRERAKSLNEIVEQSRWYLLDDAALRYDEKAKERCLTPEIRDAFDKLTDRIQALATFEEEKLEEIFKETLDQFELKFPKLAQPVRLALTGNPSGPSVALLLTVLGKDRSVTRLQRVWSKIE